jgi:hypothetical protein
MTVDPIVGDDGKLGGVDRVSALAQDFPLWALLPTAEQKFPRVFEIRLVLSVVGAKHLRRAKRCTVAGEHVGDFALSDRDQVRFVDAIHKRKENVQAAAQDFRLVTGFTVQRDEPAFDRTLCGP